MFARKPTSNGLFPSLERPSDTSVKRDFATVLANTTLQDVELLAPPSADIPSDEHVEQLSGRWSKFVIRLLVGLHDSFSC